MQDLLILLKLSFPFGLQKAVDNIQVCDIRYKVIISGVYPANLNFI
jgi:hypothetical protein